jgi:2,3-bisphosphoglycerate-independent phosphoglycerate mutase
MSIINHPTLLLILDGWGCRENVQHNAIAMAHTPCWDQIWNIYPHSLLTGSGLHVGLPDGQMGNSEVGHMTIGSGRVIYQDLTKINLAIENGSFFTNAVLTETLANIGKNNSIHLLGLLSTGGIHSHSSHFHALIKLTAKYKTSQLYIHAFLDGRDTPPKSATKDILALDRLCKELNTGEIASITGRYYAMDRDKKYDRTKATYDLLTLGQTQYRTSNALEALEQAYARGETDEFVKPTLITTTSNNAIIKDGDVIVFMNFRADRTKQLSYSFTKQNFDGFTRTQIPKLKDFVTLTEYASDIPAKIAFPKIKPINVLGKHLADHKLTQLRLAETEKYAHVTFFFNGGEDLTFEKEDRKLISSPLVATYDLAPAMSAKEVTQELVTAILNNQYNVIICNLANADMVGHTGNISATIQAIETLDECLKNITEAILTSNGEAIITSDHGNAEIMYDLDNQQPHTAHTNSLLPFVYIGKRKISMLRELGTLSDVAPSLLTLLGLPIPNEMTGRTLLKIDNNI